MASDKITADMVSGAEFPHLLVKYNVNGVPYTVINDDHGFTGALPETELADEVLKAVDTEKPST